MKHINQNKRGNYEPLHRRVGGSSANSSYEVNTMEQASQTDLNLTNLTKILDHYGT